MFGKILDTLLSYFSVYHTAPKLKFSIRDFFSKCDQIHSFLWIWSHLLKKFSFENFIFMQTSFLSFLDQRFIDKNVRYKK